MVRKTEKPVAVILGGTGFIGSNLINFLKQRGWYVIASDIQDVQQGAEPDEFIKGDLRDIEVMKLVIPPEADRVYQLAADVGGAGYIFSGEHDAAIIYSSAQINLNAAKVCELRGVKKVFFPSSSCIYPVSMQNESYNSGLKEADAYPSEPDSVYGWEKLFGEQLWEAFAQNTDMVVKIARYQNIYGPFAPFKGLRAKAPEAISYKAISNPEVIEIWGDGKQTRSFIYIDDCLEAMELLMNHSDFDGPVNMGTEEDISIGDMTELIRDIVSSRARIKHIEGPQGVRGKKSDNSLVEEKLNWSPSHSMKEGLTKLIRWIKEKEENYG